MGTIETLEDIENDIAEIEMEIAQLEDNENGEVEIDSLTEQGTEEANDDDEEYSVSGSILTPFVKSSPMQLSQVNFNDISSYDNSKKHDDKDDDYDKGGDYDKNDKDTKDTKDVNRKETYTEQIAEDEESDDEYDIARGFLFAKSESDAETEEQTIGGLNGDFDKNDVAVLFVIVVIAMLS